MSVAHSLLLVEDEEADIAHFRRLSRKHKLNAEIVVARDASVALEILRRHAHDPLRHVVVTDLNLPGLSGHELIEEIRGDALLASNVVFVISTSDRREDIQRAYCQQVAGYIVKDTQGERLEAGVSMLSQYFQAVALW